MAEFDHSVENISQTISFPEEEEKVLEMWERINAFERSVELSEGKKEYTFYDGPPFATGLPHYGHILGISKLKFDFFLSLKFLFLAGTIKDVVTRFAHQTGHHVVRRFGWDCHGLPVEYEIDQQLGITDRQQVFRVG